MKAIRELPQHQMLNKCSTNAQPNAQQMLNKKGSTIQKGSTDDVKDDSLFEDRTPENIIHDEE